MPSLPLTTVLTISPSAAQRAHRSNSTTECGVAVFDTVRKRGIATDLWTPTTIAPVRRRREARSLRGPGGRHASASREVGHCPFILSGSGRMAMIEAGAQAPDFDAPTSQGHNLKLSSLRGKSV